MTPLTIELIEKILNEFPEVTWDRWAENAPLSRMTVFGWIPRDDGKQDFVVLRIIFGELDSVLTSSAKFSAAFAARIGAKHTDCNRVEHTFKNVKAVHL